MRVTPPWLSDTSMSSPGATRKRYLSLFCSGQSPRIVMQASPGVLENDEICPVGPTEPTISRLFGAARPTHGTSAVCMTPSLPAAFTMTNACFLLLSREPLTMLPHSLDSVQPGTPSEAFTTNAPLLFSVLMPAATSLQLAVPVWSKGL